MTNLDSVLKSSDTTVPSNVRIVKAMIFPIVMYESKRRVKKLVKAQYSENKDRGIQSHHFMANTWGK